MRGYSLGASFQQILTRKRLNPTKRCLSFAIALLVILTSGFFAAFAEELLDLDFRFLSPGYSLGASGTLGSSNTLGMSAAFARLDLTPVTVTSFANLQNAINEAQPDVPLVIQVSSGFAYSSSLIIDVGDKDYDITIMAPEGKTLSHTKSGSVRHITVIGNGGSLTLTLDRLTLNGGNNGGGISVSGADFTFLDGTVAYCSNGIGGGMHFSGDNTFTIAGGTITNNLAASTSNKSGEGNGAGIYCNGGTLVISDGTISNNSATNTMDYRDRAQGGGVYFNGTNFVMEGGDITGNSVTCSATGQNTTIGGRGAGGGIYLNAGSFTLKDGKISNNTASSTNSQVLYFRGLGGGVFVGKDAIFYMEDGEISENTAYSNDYLNQSLNNENVSGAGGGVFCLSEFYMSGGTIHNNTADNNYYKTGSTWRGGVGGGIYLYGATLDINGGTICENIAQSQIATNGGGIYVLMGDVKIHNAIISRNITQIRPSATVRTNIGSGGGIFVSRITGNGGSLEIYDTEIEGNISGDRSAGIYFYGRILVLENTNLKGNKISGQYTGGSNYYGGVYAYASETALIRNCTFTENVASRYAAFSIDGNGSLTMIGCTITENQSIAGATSVGEGGGEIRIAQALVKDCTVSKNTGVFRSGLTIYKCEATLDNVNFLDNIIFDPTISSAKGGALNIQNSDVEIYNSKIIGHHANSGGGIYIDGTVDVKISSTEIKNNLAEEYGGGIYTTYANLSNLMIESDVVFSDNDSVLGAYEMQPADQELHDRQVKTTSFSEGLDYGYNNLDIYYDKGPIKSRHTVAFESNGGSVVNSQTVYSGSRAKEPEKPTHTSLFFQGWYSDVELETLYNFSTLVTNDITLYAKWGDAPLPEPEEYTVTFDTDGGSPVPLQKVKEGEKATRPATNPTKDSYEFDGWFADENCTTPFDFDTVITSNTTVYAKWRDGNGGGTNPQPEEFTVTFDTDGGSPVPLQKVKEGEKATRPATNPTKDSYEFDGWFADENCTTPFDFDTVITSNTTVYAKWRDGNGGGTNPQPEEFTVTFDTDGGSPVPLQKVKEGEKATRPATNPTKDSYEFDGWFADENCTTPFDFDTVITSNTTVYAKWKDGNGGGTNPQPEEFTVTFDTDGGSSVPLQKVKEGEKATRPATNPTKDSYEFDGWFADVNCTTPFDFDTVITSNTTVYAKWKDGNGGGTNPQPEEFTVTFDTDGGSSVPLQKVKEGEKATRPTTDPTKSNYEFDGWFADENCTTPFDFDTVITSNTTVYAKWKDGNGGGTNPGDGGGTNPGDGGDTNPGDGGGTNPGDGGGTNPGDGGGTNPGDGGGTNPGDGGGTTPGDGGGTNPGDGGGTTPGDGGGRDRESGTDKKDREEDYYKPDSSSNNDDGSASGPTDSTLSSTANNAANLSKDDSVLTVKDNPGTGNVEHMPFVILITVFAAAIMVIKAYKHDNL